MTTDQSLLLGLLALLFVFFILGRWRYDIVALTALLLATLGGLVPTADAFRGFSHPATITIAAVLIISRAFINTGMIDVVTRLVKDRLSSPTAHIVSLSGLGALLSTVMNNVGALALLMPVALQTSVEAKRSPAIILMPLAFATMLGGMATLIGTPPNIIIAAYRAEVEGTPFGMFDFSPAGGIVALIGLLFVTFIGWRLIPSERRNQSPSQDLFHIEDYVSEVRVPEDSKAVGKTLDELEAETEDSDALIVGLVRGNRPISMSAWWERIQAGDSIILESDTKGIDTFVTTLDLEFVGQSEEEETQDGAPKKDKTDRFVFDKSVLMEAVIPPEHSWLIGRTPRRLKLRTRFGVNLLAASRQGTPHRGRLSLFCFQAGDVLLLQGEQEQMMEVISRFGCLPLAERQLQVGKRHLALFSAGIFGLSITMATLGVISLPLALLSAAVAMVLVNMVPIRDVYDAVDWPVIVLIAAMIPIGRAFESSGLTGVIADQFVHVTSGYSPAIILGLLMILTMTLSDIMNNTATTVVMAPIGVALAHQLGLNPDSFLMAIAIGASCAFLTPIGHQNNLLIMGPGGYRFGDYWRMGLPLELLIIAISIPAILWAWPLSP